MDQELRIGSKKLFINNQDYCQIFFRQFDEDQLKAALFEEEERQIFGLCQEMMEYGNSKGYDLSRKTTTNENNHFKSRFP